MTQTGVCFASDIRSSGDVIFYMDDPDKIKEMINAARLPRKTYDEALEYLYSHPDYTVSERMDNDGYTVLSMLSKAEGGYIYVAVKKTGGYLKIEDYSSYPDRDMAMSFEGNTVKITIYPFAGPHGATTLASHHDLDSLGF